MKDYKPKCNDCGKYTGYNNQVGIPYGCQYTPDPEPLDEQFFCNKCAKKKKEELKKLIIKNGEGEFYGLYWWLRPKFVSDALRETKYLLSRKSDNTCYILNKIKK